MEKYWISIDALDFEINLRNTETAKKIIQNLPIKGECQKWGKEFYFYTDLKIPLEETAKQVISFGEIAYWPAGDAIAIGYGRTPLSVGNEIRLADKCNIWAETKFDLNKLQYYLNKQKLLDHL